MKPSHLSKYPITPYFLLFNSEKFTLICILFKVKLYKGHYNVHPPFYFQLLEMVIGSTFYCYYCVCKKTSQGLPDMQKVYLLLQECLLSRN